MAHLYNRNAPDKLFAIDETKEGCCPYRRKPPLLVLDAEGGHYGTNQGPEVRRYKPPKIVQCACSDAASIRPRAPSTPPRRHPAQRQGRSPRSAVPPGVPTLAPGPHPVSLLVKEGYQLVAISFDACRQRPPYVFAIRLGCYVVSRVLHTPPPQGAKRPDHMTLVTSNLRLASLPSGKDHP